MVLYLMQHGEATSEEEDPERPLTSAGRTAVERVASRAAHAGVHLSRCFHSGKLRAQQSGEILVGAMGGHLEVREGLSPKDPVAPVVAWLRHVDEPAVAVVGHLPFLDRLASTLLAGDEDAAVVRFHMGGLVALEPQEESDRYALTWALPPDLA